MAAERKTQVVAIRKTDYEAAKAMQGELERIFERRASLQDVLGRALLALADAHSRKAWLSPKEMIPANPTRSRTGAQTL